MGRHLHGHSDLDSTTGQDAYSAPPTVDYIPPTPFTQQYRDHAPVRTPTTQPREPYKTRGDAQDDSSGTKTAEVTPKAAPVGLPEQQSKGQSHGTEKQVEAQKSSMQILAPHSSNERAAGVE